MAARWRVVATSLSGTNRGDVPYEDLELTRRLNGAASVSLRCDVLDDVAPELVPGSRALKVYRDSTLVFFGKIGEPHEDDPDDVTVNAYDPFWWLDWRRIYKASDATYSLERKFTATDAGQIAKTLIDESSTRSTTRIRTTSVSIPVSRTRDRTYEAGKVLSEAIRELAEVDDGFWFYIDPVDNVAGVMGDLVVLYPNAGSDRPGLRWEYGAGTLDNLEKFRRTLSVPRNGVTATGDLGRDQQGQVARAEDAASIAANDLIEDEFAFSGVVLVATLQEHAQEELEPAVRVVYSIDPRATEGEDPNPELFADFDVGDRGRLTIDHGRVQDIDVTVQIDEATVKVANEASAEQLSSLIVSTLTAPSTVVASGPSARMAKSTRDYG